VLESKNGPVRVEFYEFDAQSQEEKESGSGWACALGKCFG